MSILIKGMEMPHCEVLTIRISPNGEVHYIGAVGQSARRAEAVEIPPHGRLIDADALTKTISEHVYPVTDYLNSRDYGMFWTGGIEKAINEQPTIIEAEE